jgi:4-hydroxy-tetrahydrodipicolinate reductase
MSKINVAIAGATGRMGRRLVAVGSSKPALAITAGTTHDADPLLGKDLGELAGVGALGAVATAELTGAIDVVIDFSAPAAFRKWLPACVAKKIPMIVGTTGLTDDDQSAINNAAKQIAILQSTNMSLGVAVLNQVAAQVAKMLGDDYDIEIVESHHKHKKDAPSGTALTLLEHILQATGKTKSQVVNGRDGAEALREPGSIGMHALRMGDVVGIHTVHYATDGERLEFTHTATNRDVFVQGALRAAQWIVTQKPGRYTMRDVLGL